MTDTEEVKKKQGRNLAIVVAILIAIFTALYFVINDKPTLKVQNQKAEFASPLQHVNAESVLISRVESRLFNAEKTTIDLKKQLEALTKDRDAQKDALPKELKGLADEVAALKQEIHGSGEGSSQKYTGSIFPAPVGDKLGAQQPHAMQGIRDDAVSLAATTRDLVPLKNPETYVPSGTFAKAVMLGGADASAAVNAQSDPTPMLFRVIEDGTMPNNKKSHLKGCLATAAVAGDISSERGKIRLETLSCVDSDSNRILDTKVEGTVFGPEGKNGIRGIPIWRDGALLQRAFFAGALSGFGSGISQKYVTNSVSPLGSTQTIDNSDIFKYGAASGISNAMEKLATYNIQRAEQYHPVIQLTAGTAVDLVFLKGFYLDGQKHEETTQGDVNLNAPQQHVELANDLKPLPFTPEQIARLRAHAKELSHLTAADWK